MADLYVRMSLDRTGEALGVERQEQESRELADRLGLKIDRVHIDNDISATTGRKRPGFEALLAGKPEAIVCWHTDRLARTTKDLERVIDLGCPVYAVTAGHIDLATPAGRATARTITAWATYEGEQKALRQKASNRQRAAQGKPWWSSRPLGFELDGTHRERESSVLREGYFTILKGGSLRSVAKALNDAGIKTCRGNKWRAETLRPVMLNPRNAGLRFYADEIVGPALWDEIVPEDTWRAVYSILTDPARRVGAGRQPTYLLTGFATCAECGGPVKAAMRKKYMTYSCRFGHHVSVPSEFTDGLVWRKIIKAASEKGTLPWQQPERDVDTTALAMEAATLRQRLEDLATDYAEGLISRAQLQAGSERLRIRLTEAEAAMSAARPVIDISDVEWVYEEIEKMDTERRRLIVRSVVDSVRLIPVGKGRRPTAANVEIILR